MSAKCSNLYGCAMLLLVLLAADAQAVPTVTGSLHSLITELTSNTYFLQHPRRDPRPYINPSDDLPTLYRASRHMAGGDVEEAARLANQVGCEVVRFVDENTKADYLLLREDISELNAPRGWGSYLYNPASEIPALIEAPHAIDDSNSAKVAELVFARGAQGLLLAGAQRDKADVPDMVDSVFHQVHVAWTGAMGQVAVWQIHGFAIKNHKFPDDAKAILSTGNGEMINEIVEAQARLSKGGISGYAYNRLKEDAELNKTVNQGTPGIRFTSLAATKNEQGKHLRSIGGTFVHVELERAVRSDAEQRRIAAEAIADAMVATARQRRAERQEAEERVTRQSTTPRRA